MGSTLYTCEIGELVDIMRRERCEEISCPHLVADPLMPARHTCELLEARHAAEGERSRQEEEEERVREREEERRVEGMKREHEAERREQDRIRAEVEEMLEQDRRRSEEWRETLAETVGRLEVSWPGEEE